ncbi:type II toxin-antitoxin system Phd/YefM family antitoxin [Gemmata sp.]|uniref:type II toxin-antitoxin system Phd/YefM family antitoxin n=1 Tax=Gemmata sp. TaxID=1914242 RepID=UPI003F725EF1
MNVVIVSMAEAQADLPALIARVAAGDQVVIAEDGRSVAELSRPPRFPTTPEEIAAAAPLRAALFRSVIEGHERAGEPLPADHPLRAALAVEERG